ncbi:hypothetical protein H4I96_12084 [Botrytis cinerea]
MPGLLRLPLELRNQIYRYLIPVKRIIEVSRPCFKYTISNKGALGLDIAGLDVEDVVSYSYNSRLEQGEQALSDIGTLDNNLSISETKGGDPESGLQKDTHMKDVADFGGCTNSAYEIDWDQVTTSWAPTERRIAFSWCVNKFRRKPWMLCMARMPFGIISTQREIFVSRRTLPTQTEAE